MRKACAEFWQAQVALGFGLSGGDFERSSGACAEVSDGGGGGNKPMLVALTGATRSSRPAFNRVLRVLLSWGNGEDLSCLSSGV